MAYKEMNMASQSCSFNHLTQTLSVITGQDDKNFTLSVPDNGDAQILILVSASVLFWWNQISIGKAINSQSILTDTFYEFT